MRKTLCVVVAFGINWALVGRSGADDQSDARAIVAKAIKAAGGAEKLEKFKARTWKDTGIYYGMGDGLPYSANNAAQGPSQARMEIVGVFTIVLNGDMGWMQANGETREMTAEELAEQQAEHQVGWATRLVPLADKKFKLSKIGDTKVDDRPAVGIRVSAEKQRDVNLYFDKETGLLVKTEHRAKSTEQGGKEVNQETFFIGYKEIDGAKIPVKFLIKRDGQKFVEAEIDDLKGVGKLDDSVFGKP